MSRRLYRTATLTIFQTVTNSVIIRKLHMSFDITKTKDKEPNEMTLRLSNASSITRGFLEKKNLKLFLDVGYEDSPQQRVFTGDVTWSFSQKMRTTWVTTIEAADGAKKFKRARLAKSFRAGTSAAQALDQLASAMKVKVPKNARAAIADHKFLAGLTVQGPVSKEITKLLARVGLDWSIQDEQLQILGPSEVVANEAVLVAQSTGMVGSPQLSSPTERGKKSILTTDILLEPRIIPGVKIAVRSLSVTGDFKVSRVSHVGDTKTGSDWISSLEAEPL